MGISDKIKCKENRIKVKRVRAGNIKDFHGRRQHGENKLIQEETKNILETSNIMPASKSHIPEEFPCPCPKLFTIPHLTPENSAANNLQNKTKQVNNRPDVPTETNKFSFDAHMSQWSRDLRKPLVIPSTNNEFEMPYCYSEGLHSKVSAKSFLKQPFSSMGEPQMELWSPHTDSWYEKAQLALQYYRHLCEQPSRMPLQTIRIKRNLAQLAAEQCALLGVGTGMYFEMFHNSGFRLGKFVLEEKNKSTLYLIPDHVNTDKYIEGSDVLKYESSIFTSSWQH